MDNIVKKTLLLFLVGYQLVEGSDPPNSWGLDQNSFELRSEVTLNQIEIGDILDFRLTLRPAGDPDEDTLIFEISASYNGYSCLIFCGDPEISFSDVMDPEKYTYSRYGVTYDKVFEGISYDSYVYDFGTVNPLPGEQIIVDFKMLVADNPQYTPQTQYWMGVGVEYNNSRSIWVNDIAFTLADRPPQYEGEQARFDISSEIYTYAPGASQSNYLVLIDPHISMGFRLVVNLTNDDDDNMCICDVRPFHMAASFIGCQNPSFPPYVARSLPPFNDTKCKKEFQLDYGLLTKLNIPFADQYDTVVMEIIMCAKDIADGEYEMQVFLDTSASPEIPQVHQTLTFIKSPLEELTSFPCSIEVVYNKFKKGSEISIVATVDPAPYDTSTVYKVQHNLEIKNCAKKDPILNLRPRLVMRSRYVEFMEEISFTNHSGLLVAEYDSFMVTRMHHTLYTEQKHFRFVIDFSGTLNVDSTECPDLVISSDVILVTSSNQAFSQCPLVDYQINTTNAVNQNCSPPELKLLNIADLENPSWAMHAGSETFLSFSYTMTDENCKATVLEDVRLTTAIPQDEPNYPSLLTLKRFRLTHAGDNFPSLQRQILSDVFERPNLHTTPYFKIGSVWSSLEFGDVDYIAVNSQDLYDRQIVLTAEFYLYNDGLINASWTNDITFFSGNYDEGGWVESVQLLIYYDVNTTELILPDYASEFSRTDPPNNDLVKLDVEYPYPKWMPEDDYRDEGFVWNLEKQVKAWSVSFYVPSHPDFNEMALAVYITGKEAHAEYESVQILPGRNIYLQPMNDSFTFTNNESDLDGAVPEGVWSVANLESFKNETKRDDMLQVYIQMRAVSPRTTSDLQCVHFCYISYYTNKVEKCVKDCQEIPGTEALVVGGINEISSTMEFQEGSIGIPQKGAGPVEFTLYLAPRSIIDLRVEISASMNHLAQTKPCTPIVQSLELISIGQYVGYPDYDSFELQECTSFSMMGETNVCNKIEAHFGHVSNLNFDRASKVEIEEHKMNFVAIIGVDEECLADAGEINLIVEFKDMNTVNQTFLKTINSLVTVVDLPDPVPRKSIYSNVHFYRDGRIVRERLVTMSGQVERYLVEVFMDDDVTDQVKVSVGSDVSSDGSDPSDGGADFVVQGVYLWDLGSDIYGAFDLKNSLDLNFYSLMENGDGPILGFQENMAIINLGIISHIPNSARALKSVNDRPTTETHKNSFLLAIDIELQDEPRIVEGFDNITFTVSVEAVRHSIVHSYSFKLNPIFEPSRLPLITMILTSYFLVSREAVPGDQGTYGIQLYHICESRSEARDLRIVIHMPDYANYVSADWINNIGRPAIRTISKDDSVEFEFISLHRTEYLSFNVTFEFAHGHSYFKVARIYFTSLPMEYFYGQLERPTDDTRTVSLFSPKINTELIQLYVPESSCGNLIDIHDLSVNNPCQLTASSYRDPVTYPTTASDLFNEKGFVSSNWGGQYAVGQIFRVALLEDHFVSRIYVSLNTTVRKFKVRFSLDDEGQFWRQYVELEVWREFDMAQTYPSAIPSHLDKMAETGLKVGYFDLRVLQRMKWIEFLFTELESDDAGIKWRFQLVGCQPNDVVEGSYIRACGLEVNSAVRPEAYKRGFIADPDGRALYVCEENLYKNNLMECFRMLIKNGRYQWTKMNGVVASIVGYLVRPEYQLFAIGRSQKTYMATTDVGRNWITVPTKDWWSARAQSRAKFKQAKDMPSMLPLLQLDDSTFDWSDLEDSWYDQDMFRANNTGIYHKPDETTPWILVYNWGKICCAA